MSLIRFVSMDSFKSPASLLLVLLRIWLSIFFHDVDCWITSSFPKIKCFLREQYEESKLFAVRREHVVICVFILCELADLMRLDITSVLRNHTKNSLTMTFVIRICSDLNVLLGAICIIQPHMVTFRAPAHVEKMEGTNDGLLVSDSPKSNKDKICNIV